MWTMLANLAAKGYSLWTEKEVQEEKNKDWERQLRVSKTLSAKALATTYNSIAQASLEAATLAKREEFAIRTAQRKKAGEVAAQAAHTGARGRRATLHQEKESIVPAERAITDLDIDAKRKQDALMRQADAAAEKAVTSLILSQPDIPDQLDGGAMALDLFDTTLKSYQTWRENEQEKDDLIVDPYPGKSGR